MCGRVVQSSGPLRLAIVEGLDVSDSRLGDVPRRYNAAPSQELLVIRQNHKTGERSLDLLKWGLIPHWCTDPRRSQAHQRQSRERLKASNVQGCLCLAALHRPGRWLLRVESHQRCAWQATLCHSDEG
jgi:putative SOS response-associated peptidase YedK